MFGLVPRPAPKDVKFVLCDTTARIEELFTALDRAKEYAWDIETTHPTRGDKADDSDFIESGGLDEKVCGISFCWSPQVVMYLPLFRDKNGRTHLSRAHGRACIYDRVVRLLRRELEQANKDRFTWNGIFDRAWMWFCFGIKVPASASDGMLAHHLLDENRAKAASHGLKDCAAADLDPAANRYERDIHDALDLYDRALGRYSEVPLEILYPYGCADAYYTYRLVQIYEERLRAEGIDKLYFATVMPLQDVVLRMRVTGLPVDESRIEAVSAELATELSDLNQKIWAAAGRQFDAGSAEQLSRVLFDDLGLKAIGQRGAAGFYSTSKEVLASLEDEHSIIPLVQRHRRVVKLKGTYVDGLRKLLVEGRYYPDYRIHGTVSGRFSERLINLLPRGEKGGAAIKGLFVAPPGWSFLARDISQIELRIVAHLSDDALLVDGFCNGGPGYDPHSATAVRLFKIEIPPEMDPSSYVKKHHKPKRSIAKNCGFLTIYGGREHRLGTMMATEFPDIWPDKDKAIEEARGFLEAYFQVHPGVKRAIEETHTFVRQHGYVATMFGRRRRLADAQIANVPEPDKADRPTRWPLRGCFGRHSPSLMYDLGYGRGPVLDGMEREAAQAVICGDDKLKNDRRYVQPVGDRETACVDCYYLVPCMYMKEHRNRQRLVEEANRQAFNMLVQSAAVDYTNYAFVLIQREIEKRGLRSRPVLHIHDQLGFLVPDEELEWMIEVTKDKMENAYALKVPVASDLSVGRSWGDFDLQVPSDCPSCQSKVLVVRGKIAQMGEVTRYVEISATCGCGWSWMHPAVFETELS